MCIYTLSFTNDIWNDVCIHNDIAKSFVVGPWIPTRKTKWMENVQLHMISAFSISQWTSLSPDTNTSGDYTGFSGTLTLIPDAMADQKSMDGT